MIIIRFPADNTLRNKWIRIVRIGNSNPDFTPKASSIVCSEHFDITEIIQAKKPRLRVDAVPSIFNNICFEPNSVEGIFHFYLK